MRIEIDQELEKKLDAIKNKKYLGGKGHTETIRFLIAHHEQTQSIEHLLEIKLNSINQSVESAVFKGIKRLFQNLLGGGE